MSQDIGTQLSKKKLQVLLINTRRPDSVHLNYAKVQFIAQIMRL